MLRRLLPLVAGLALVTTPASAAVREGTVDDPVQPGPRATEVERAAVRYDDAEGSVRISVTFERAEERLYADVVLGTRCAFNRGLGGAVSDGGPLPLRVELGREAVSASFEGSARRFRGTPAVLDGGRTLTGMFRDDELAGQDWRCVVGRGEGEDGDHDDFGFWFAGFAPPPGPLPPYPSGCSRQAAEALTYDVLLPYAERRRPSYYRRITSRDSWFIRPPLCRDLTGDGERELIVKLSCCTASALSPWAIFMHDDIGAWHMVYARVDDIVFRLSVRGRRVRAQMPAPYHGGCTESFRFRVVRWAGSRFVSRVSRRRRLGNPNRGC